MVPVFAQIVPVILSAAQNPPVLDPGHRRRTGDRTGLEECLSHEPSEWAPQEMMVQAYSADESFQPVFVPVGIFSKKKSR
jgi:hypothetical protein